MHPLGSLRAFFGIEASRVFLVGGAVRDLLLNIPRADTDLVVRLPQARCAELGFVPVRGKTTGEVWAKSIHCAGRVEMTLIEDGPGLEAELRRRDFTINAMAMTLDGGLVDPLDGRRALEERRLSCCSPRSFADDPARLFRAFRFECAGFAPDAETRSLISGGDWNAPLKGIPAERFSREMLKAFAAERPSVFYRRMAETGVGRGFLPELFSMPAVPAGPMEYHPEGDLLTHSLEVLDRAAKISPDPLARFCAFWHDIGKLATPPLEYPRHHNHDKAGEKLALEMGTRLKLTGRFTHGAAVISRLHQTAGLWPGLRDSTRLKMAHTASRAGLSKVLPVVVAADRGGFDSAQWELALKVSAMGAAELGIDPRLFKECKDDDWCREKCPLRKRGKRCPMPERDRPAFITQRRVELFRKMQSAPAKEGDERGQGLMESAPM